MNRAARTALPLIALGLAACIGAPEPSEEENDPTAASTTDDGAENDPPPVKYPVRNAALKQTPALVSQDTVSNFASTVASTSSGIKYHGGAVMTGGATVYFIWYGSWSGNSATTILTDLVSNIGGSAWFNINTTYANTTAFVKNDVTYGGSTEDAYSQGIALTDAKVKTIVSNAVGSGALPPDPNGVYFVLTSSDVSETSGFCTEYCGWHNHATIGGQDIKYAFVGNTDRCPAVCEWQTLGPNNNGGADGMASILAHELSETVTDPDLDAWYDATGYENADKCMWKFGATYQPFPGAEANVRIGDRDFLIQQNWLNLGSGSCSVAYGSAASASGVAVSGTPYVSSTLTGTYTFSDSAGLPESGSTYQWYRGASAIAGATGLTYAPTGADTNGTLRFCVIPADVNGKGSQVCSSAVTVPGVIWYTGGSQTGTGTPEPSTNGACVAMSSVGTAASFNSLRLDGQASGTTTITMYTSTNCSGSIWTRNAGANTVHNIDLTTVGIGSAIRSYKITW